MNIQVINKSKHPLPAYATELSAGMDIRANLSEPITLEDRKSTRLNSSHMPKSRMPSSA